MVPLAVTEARHRSDPGTFLQGQLFPGLVLKTCLTMLDSCASLINSSNRVPISSLDYGPLPSGGSEADVSSGLARELHRRWRVHSARRQRGGGTAGQKGSEQWLGLDVCWNLQIILGKPLEDVEKLTPIVRCLHPLSNDKLLV